MINLIDVLQAEDPSIAGLSGAALASWVQMPFAHVVIDSRLATPGDLFVALPGEHVDGHRFVADGLRRGARAALVRDAWIRNEGAVLDVPVVRSIAELAGVDAGPVICAVNDPLRTVQQVAAAYRRRFDLAVVGITGSVGKTTTKEVVGAVLRQHFPTLWSTKSFNNEIGVPLTLLQLEPEHQAAVIEMGTYGPGEIALLCEWAQPRYGIVTNVGVSHLERMQTSDVVAQAKSELPQALPPDGAAILNYDDHRVRAMAQATAARPIFYGLDPQADVWADAISGHGLDGVSFTVHTHDDTQRLRMPLVGQHHVYTALAAIALARELGIGWDQIAAGLCDTAVEQRIKVLRGVNGTTILDDTYNAAPVSVKAALQLLAGLPGRHIAVLADMAELGPLEEVGHRDVGRAAAPVVDALVVVGAKARWIGEAAQETEATLPVMFVGNNGEAVGVLREILMAGDHVLIKGARVAQTEEIVRALAEG